MVCHAVMLDANWPDVEGLTYGDAMDAFTWHPPPWLATTLWTMNDAMRASRMGLPPTATVGDDVPKLIGHILTSGLLTDRMFTAGDPDAQLGEVVTTESIIGAVSSGGWIPDADVVANLMRGFADTYDGEDTRCVDEEFQRRRDIDADSRVPIKWAPRPGATEQKRTDLTAGYVIWLDKEHTEVQQLAHRRKTAFVLAALTGYVAMDLSHRAFAFNPASQAGQGDMSSNILKGLDFQSCWTPREVVLAARAAAAKAQTAAGSSNTHHIPL